MSYHIYNVTGLVLKERPSKEADLSLKILTRELGLLNAMAVGIRKGNSRRRPPLTELSLSKISLVRGKKDWRVTSASLEANLYQELKGNKPILLSVTRALHLIEKLVQGEEKHPELYDTVKEFVDFALVEKINEDDAKMFEVLLVSRIMSRLGYLSEKDLSQEIFTGVLSKELLATSKASEKKLVTAINQGIRESGLVK